MSKEKRAYIDVNIPREWQSFLDEALANVKIKTQLELEGFSLKYSGLGAWIIREFLLQNTSFRFEHINTKEDHITLMDKKIRRVVDVYPRQEEHKLWCEQCQRSDCEHAKYAFSLPEVKQALKKKGWEMS